jgi:hypothetical protein
LEIRSGTPECFKCSFIIIESLQEDLCLMIHILVTGWATTFLSVLISFAQTRNRCPSISSLKLGADTLSIPAGSTPSSNYHIQLFRYYYSDAADPDACVCVCVCVCSTCNENPKTVHPVTTRSSNACNGVTPRRNESVSA